MEHVVPMNVIIDMLLNLSIFDLENLGLMFGAFQRMRQMLKKFYLNFGKLLG